MLQPTGNRVIDTFIYVAGSAFIFNVALPIFAGFLKLAELLGLM